MRSIASSILGPWTLLLLSGLLEVGWASMLPRTEGFTRLWPSLVLLALLSGSMLGLAVAARDIPIGTAYAVWVGVGATGAAIAGITLYGEPASALRMLCLGLIVAGVVGLRLSDGLLPGR